MRMAVSLREMKERERVREEREKEKKGSSHSCQNLVFIRLTQNIAQEIFQNIYLMAETQNDEQQ